MERTYSVLWIRHCVERSNSQRIFIQNIEVGIILQRKSNHVSDIQIVKVTSSLISAEKKAKMGVVLVRGGGYSVLHLKTKPMYLR